MDFGALSLSYIPAMLLLLLFLMLTETEIIMNNNLIIQSL